MRVIETKVYKFEELTEKAQEKALEYVKDYNYQDSDMLMFFKDELNVGAEEQLGLENAEFTYSLSSSQGDGVRCLEGTFKKEVVKKLFQEILGEGKEKRIDIILDYVSFYIEPVGHSRYFYATSQDVSVEFYFEGDLYNVENIISDVRSILGDKLYTFCQNKEEIGYKEIEYRMGEECARIDLNEGWAMDLEFTEDGTVFG